MTGTPANLNKAAVGSPIDTFDEDACCHTSWTAVSSLTVEHSFTCPYCGEEISMVLDLSVSGDAYIEDCEVCCNPIEIRYTVEDDTLGDFEANVSQ